jgi:hypothetical protein
VIESKQANGKFEGDLLILDEIERAAIMENEDPEQQAVLETQIKENKLRRAGQLASVCTPDE